MASWIHEVQMSWFAFRYNFGWSAYAGLLDGWIPRLAMTVPIVGYLILFNDSVSSQLSFEDLASEVTSSFGITGSTRLKFIYLGLVTLGVANLIFKWKRPYLFRLASHRSEWVDRGFKQFSMADYVNFHEKISYSNLGPATGDGKYDDAERDDFVDSALGPQLGSGGFRRDHKKAHWNEAKLKHESLLRSILTETYFRDDTRIRRGWLISCLAIASVGYSLLAIPSIDLFLKVMLVIISPGATP